VAPVTPRLRRTAASCLVTLTALACSQAARPGPVAASAGSVTSRSLPAAGAALDPALFAAGSCLSFAPTRGDRHRTVFLDAGHGGVDPGATGVTLSGRPVYEAVETLAVELDTMALLRADGYRVAVSRTGNSTVARMASGDLSGGIFSVEGEHRDVIARPHCANAAHADLLIGIYFNASSSSQSSGSITAYDALRPFARASERIAELVQRDVLSELDRHGFAIPDDGVQTDAGLGGVPLTYDASTYGHLLLLGPGKLGYFSRPSAMPGALIEPLFVTNPREASLVVRPIVQRLIAAGLANAVEQYFD
jgi:N-acetylmuramoyl-L-alanine amidase